MPLRNDLVFVIGIMKASVMAVVSVSLLLACWHLRSTSVKDMSFWGEKNKDQRSRNDSIGLAFLERD